MTVGLAPAERLKLAARTDAQATRYTAICVHGPCCLSKYAGISDVGVSSIHMCEERGPRVRGYAWLHVELAAPGLVH